MKSLKKVIIFPVLTLYTINLTAQSHEAITLFTSGENEVSCYRIPALCVAPDSSLIAVADQRIPSCGDLVWNHNINLVMRKSRDNGKTWSTMKTIVDFEDGISASDPSFIVDKETGKIFLFFNTMNHSPDEKEYRHMVMESSDNGTTWTQPIDFTDQICSPDMRKLFRFVTSGRGIQCNNGTLLHTLVTIEKGVFIFGSKDHGKSWFRWPTPIQPADESQLAELTDGTLILSARVNRKGYRLVYTSVDEGHTWIRVGDTTHSDPGCNGGLIPLQVDGRDFLLLSHIHHPSDRKNLTLCFSTDKGKSWEIGQNLFEGPAAYSSLALLPNNKLGVLYESEDYRAIKFLMVDFIHFSE